MTFARRSHALAALALLALAAPVRAGDAPPQPPQPPGSPPGAAQPPQPVAPQAGPEAKAALLAELKSLAIGEPIVAEQLILFPVVRPQVPPAPLVIRPVLGGTVLSFSETSPADGRDLVRVTNPTATPALLVGGTVLEGGKRDRVVREDHLIGPNTFADVPVLPASMTSDRRKDEIPFRVLAFLAPPYLRDQAVFNPSRDTTPKFVSHFLEFRDPIDLRKSMAAVGDSVRLEDYCLVCQRSFSEWPVAPGPAVLGGIAVVRGRAQAMEVFASNELLRSFFAPLLRSLSFPAAAIELRAKKAGVPLPGRDDPAKTLLAARKTVADLMTALASVSPEPRTQPAGTVASSWTLKVGDDARGTALVHEGRLVHLALFPTDPFEYALYAQAVVPIESEDTSRDANTQREGFVELARRERQGSRLTVEEQRLLDRLRERLGPR
jgi:hypothetical protein